MNAASPWWGVPIVAGCFLIIGGLLSAMYVRMNDRRKLLEEDRRKWDSELLEVAVKTLAAAGDVAEVRRGEYRRQPDYGDSWRDNLYNKFVLEHQGLLIRLDLLGAAAVAEAGKTLIQEAINFANQSAIRTADEVEPSVPWVGARTAYVQVVRQQLRIQIDDGALVSVSSRRPDEWLNW